MFQRFEFYNFLPAGPKPSTPKYWVPKIFVTPHVRDLWPNTPCKTRVKEKISSRSRHFKLDVPASEIVSIP